MQLRIFCSSESFAAEKSQLATDHAGHGEVLVKAVAAAYLELRLHSEAKFKNQEAKYETKQKSGILAKRQICQKQLHFHGM